MSSIAAWWAIPVVATLLAMAWTAWASRVRGPGDVSDTTRRYDKFRAAMERPSVKTEVVPRQSRLSRLTHKAAPGPAGAGGRLDETSHP
jgi:hypothetical protein